MRLSFKHLAVVAVALLAALVLAACGGDNGGSGDNGGRGGAATMSGGSSLVSVRSVDGTKVLADADGKTLYNADVEKSRILCTDGCTSFWEPLAASAKQAKAASADLGLDFGVVKRPDGADQLTLKGLPLYSFKEEGAGQLEGNGFVDDFNGTHFEWTAATTGAASASSGSNSSSYNSPY